MKRLDKASGYFQTVDPTTGALIEGETRSCVHCGFMWIYDPTNEFKRKIGLTSIKPVLRGTCLNCRGLVCARDDCLKAGCVPLAKRIEDMEHPKSAGGFLLA